VVSVRAEGNLIRTGTLKNMEFRETLKFQIEFLFIRNPDLLGNGRLPLVVQNFKYSEFALRIRDEKLTWDLHPEKRGVISPQVLE
jgi:hypothetical protein